MAAAMATRDMGTGMFPSYQLCVGGRGLLAVRLLAVSYWFRAIGSTLTEDAAKNRPRDVAAKVVRGLARGVALYEAARLFS